MQDRHPPGSGSINSAKLLGWIRQHPWLSLFYALLLVILIILVYWALWPERSPAWTGFGPTVDPQTRANVPAKTLWDWLELLIVPGVLAVVAFWLNRSGRKRELELSLRDKEIDRQIAKSARDTERAIAANRQQQKTLEDYLDTMTRLLLDYNLREKTSSADEEKSIARTRTLAALRNLDPGRITQVFQFLRESKLIDPPDPIIDLSHANFAGVNLEGINFSNLKLQSVNLNQANLSGANIQNANLSGSELKGANLQATILCGANLRGADLYEANLSQADLSEAVVSWADLSRANLSFANFTRSSLVWTSLKEAKLHLAILKEADLRGAVLEDVDLQSASLTGARYNEDTIWPEDFEDGEAPLIFDDSPTDS